MPGLTLDTGALIAWEQRRQRMLTLLSAARDEPITVPVAIITEWWRKKTRLRDEMLAVVRVEPMSEHLAKAAGEAVGRVAGATAVDAIVMASAAARGDVVITSDVDDLERLRGHFRAVPRVLHV